MNKIIYGSYQALAGCESEEVKAFEKAFENALKKTPPEGDSDKAIFEKDLFVTWGDACLSIKHPGTYIIVAEAQNRYVVESPCEPNIKTAVGKIQSTPLTITITE